MTRPDPPIADLVAEVERRLPPNGKSTPWAWKMWGSTLRHVVARFRKKPVVIDAVQLTWANHQEIRGFVPSPWFVGYVYLDKDGNETTDAECRLGLKIKTLESQEFLAVETDWIIKGVAGEFYACKDDIFQKTYEPAE
jgi:hypothetical protein